MLLESLAVLAILANISVPVVPDPNYLQGLYPQQQQQNGLLQSPFSNNNNGQVNNTQPFDAGNMVSYAMNAVMGYFMLKNKTTVDRRTYMAADTSLKLAQNDQASDAKVVKLTYAVSCLCDIVGKYHGKDLETYDTIDGVSLWTYIENLNISNNEDFQAKYVNKSQVTTTGSASKDKVVSTFNQVQNLVTPTPASAETPNTIKKPQQSRTDINKEAT